MAVLLKYLFRSVKESKLRTFLIVFAIMLSSALFFVSTALSGTLKNNITEQMRQRYAGADIMVQGSDRMETPFFELRDLGDSEKLFKYTVGAMQGAALYVMGEESAALSLIGFDQIDLKQMDGIYLIKEPAAWDENAIILDEDTVNKYNLAVGDRLELVVEGANNTFHIAGIARSKGVFLKDGMAARAIVNKDHLARINNAEGKISIVYLKLKQESDKQIALKQTELIYDKQIVRESFTQAEVDGQISGLSMVFMQMSLLILLLSIYIVSCSFRVMAMQRLPAIGTFRSIGASKKTTGLCFIFECLTYGIIGGGAGCLLGIAALKLTATIIHSTHNYPSIVQLEFQAVQLVTTFVVALGICLISALIPLTRTLRLPLLDTILNRQDRSEIETGNYRRLIIGLLGLAVAIIIPHINGVSFFGPLSLLLLILVQLIIMPYAVPLLVRIFERPFFFIFGNEGIIALKNLKGNKNHLNSISLLGTGISIMLLIYTVGTGILASTVNFYNNSMKFDITVSAPYADEAYLESLRQIDGVSEVYGIYQNLGSIEVEGKGSAIELIQGIDPNKFTGFWNLGFNKDVNEVMNELGKGRNIVITPSLSKRLSANVGDSIILKWNNGPKTYKVIGIFKSRLSGGSVALVSGNQFKMDDGSEYYSSAYLKTSKDPAGLLGKIVSQSADNTWISTTQNLKNDELDNNEQIFSILKGIIFTIWLAGFFGIFNNLIISFMERKHFWAVLRSIGMSKSQMIKISCIESLSVGFLGGVTGVIIGSIMLTVVPSIFAAGMLPQAEVQYNLIYFIAAIAVSMGISIIASLFPMVQSRKNSLIHSIKHQ